MIAREFRRDRDGKGERGGIEVDGREEREGGERSREEMSMLERAREGGRWEGEIGRMAGKGGRSREIGMGRRRESTRVKGRDGKVGEIEEMRNGTVERE